MIRKSLIALAALGVMTLSGCQLYFGQNGDDRGDCGPFGCEGDPGIAPEPAAPGSDCATNFDCMAGCFCNARNECEEAGFCAADLDCASGFECEDSRASCVPIGSETANCNDSAAPCPIGSYCEQASGSCVDSWICSSDADCGVGMECSLQNNTCQPLRCETDAQCLEGCYCDEGFGECVESQSCSEANRDCPEGMTCDIERNTCDPTPTRVACDELNNEADCIARTDCSALYTGVNCMDPQGIPCTDGTANCQCESFDYAGCAASE